MGRMGFKMISFYLCITLVIIQVSINHCRHIEFEGRKINDLNKPAYLGDFNDWGGPSTRYDKKQARFKFIQHMNWIKRNREWRNIQNQIQTERKYHTNIYDLVNFMNQKNQIETGNVGKTHNTNIIIYKPFINIHVCENQGIQENHQNSENPYQNPNHIKGIKNSNINNVLSPPHPGIFNHRPRLPGWNNHRGFLSPVYRKPDTHHQIEVIRMKTTQRDPNAYLYPSTHDILPHPHPGIYNHRPRLPGWNNHPDSTHPFLRRPYFSHEFNVDGMGSIRKLPNAYLHPSIHDILPHPHPGIFNHRPRLPGWNNHPDSTHPFLRRPYFLHEFNVNGMGSIRIFPNAYRHPNTHDILSHPHPGIFNHRPRLPGWNNHRNMKEKFHERLIWNSILNSHRSGILRGRSNFGINDVFWPKYNGIYDHRYGYFRRNMNDYLRYSHDPNFFRNLRNHNSNRNFNRYINSHGNQIGSFHHQSKYLGNQIHLDLNYEISDNDHLSGRGKIDFSPLIYDIRRFFSSYFSKNKPLINEHHKSAAGGDYPKPLIKTSLEECDDESNGEDIFESLKPPLFGIGQRLFYPHTYNGNHLNSRYPFGTGLNGYYHG